MEKRTDWDFSGFQHKTVIFKSEDSKTIRIDKLQNGNSKIGYIQFLNTDENLLVTGDFGNWVFCRPFIPSPEGEVSEGYWIEKLKMNSIQNFENYDFDSIEKDIQELIDNGLEDYGYTGDKLKEAKEWFSNLLDYTDDPIEYVYHAFRDYSKPDFIDYEMIPTYKEFPVRLKIVFDAFEEICRRLK